MSREEAIKNLEALLLKANITDAYGDMEDMTPYEDAINMAIQALEQEPCDKCEVGNPCLYCKHEFEPKTGHWIPFEYGDDTWHKCTSCGCADKYITEVQRPNGTIGRLKSIRNFCPNCGARMFEPQEISDRNLKMWHDIYEEEKRREGSDKE